MQSRGNENGEIFIEDCGNAGKWHGGAIILGTGALNFAALNNKLFQKKRKEHK